MASPENKEIEGWAVRAIQQLIGREMPEVKARVTASKFSEVKQDYFRHFRIVQCGTGTGPAIHAAYRPDNSSVFLLTGRQQTLRLLAAIDPIVFKSVEDVTAFVAFADRVTSDDGDVATPVSTVDEIPCPANLAKHHKAVIEMVQEKFRDRVQPLERQLLPFGLQERFHVVSAKRLIERTLMIASGGIFFRQDEVLADNLPLGR